MLNRVVLMGRVASEIELRTTAGGTPCATFRIAVDRNYQRNGERKADFISIVVWRNTAEFVSKYFGKGQMIVLEGSL